jgi:hypothetical protein
MVEQYPHSTIRLHDVMLNLLSIWPNLPITFYVLSHAGSALRKRTGYGCLSEITADGCKNHTKHINTLCAKKTEIFTIQQVVHVATTVFYGVNWT